MPQSQVDSSSPAESTTMKSEIDSAVNFLSNILRSGAVGLSADQMMSFRRCLEATLLTRYRDHWFPDRPQRGSAYRCVRIVNRKLDRLLANAAAAAGVPEPLLERLLPTELTLWVDPEEVSYRIGEDGSVGVIYDGQATSTTSSDSSSDIAPVSRLTPSPDATAMDARISPDTVNYQFVNSVIAARAS